MKISNPAKKWPRFLDRTPYMDPTRSAWEIKDDFVPVPSNRVPLCNAMDSESKGPSELGQV